MRVILVSDTHLSPAAPEAAANWDAVLRYVGANAPDVVIHLGDLTLDGAHNAGDLHYGRRQLDRLPVPWHAIPGNHDIGDNPWPGAPGDFTVDAGRCQRWLDIVGTDHWSVTVLPDQVQPTLGAKRCGIVSLDLASGMSPEPLLVEPDGIAQLTVGTDIPDPYHS
jgi:3',5'-cyclic AMP phosphodiesterase CpdA